MPFSEYNSICTLLFGDRITGPVVSSQPGATMDFYHIQKYYYYYEVEKATHGE